MPETDITHRLPPVIAAYVRASSRADSNAFLGVFTDDALVNDIQREFWGRPAIEKWREIFGAHVTMEVMRASDHCGNVIVNAKLDGIYGKTGLPDPLILTFYFTVREDKITMLIILRNKPAENL